MTPCDDFFDTFDDPEAPPPGDPREAVRLTVLRDLSGLDAASFAARLDIGAAAYREMEAGTRLFPTAKLPRLARVLDLPLSSVVAQIHASDRRTGELRALAQAFLAIPHADQREALLSMALALTPGREP